MPLNIEELRALLGSEVGVGEWREVTQDMIAAFAEVSGDRQWIHTDVERARAESPFGATVAHGFLTLSIMPRLLADVVMVGGDFTFSVNYGVNRVRFPAPVIAGTRIRARVTLNAMKECPNHLEVVWDVVLERECGGKPALVAEWLVRKYL